MKTKQSSKDYEVQNYIAVLLLSNAVYHSNKNQSVDIVIL